MREGEFRLLQARNAKREMLVLNQWEFLETRQRALENILEHLTIWDRLMILMGLKSLKELIDTAHILLYREAQKEREAATDKAKEEARKPKFLVPLGVNGRG